MKSSTANPERPACRLHAFFGGTVQGVGFRYSVVKLAAKFAVTGWVRNRSDGRVELVAEGTRAELDAFLESILDDMSGYVDRKEITWETPTGEWTTFTIGSTH